MQANQAIENGNPKILIPYDNKLCFLEFESRDRTSIVDLHPPCEEPIFFLTSYNGLICYKVQGQRDIYLWNPSTRDNRRLPDIPSPASGYIPHSFIGSSAMDEYKIVMIIPNPDQEVWVLTLGAQSWRRVERYPRVNPWRGVCINGALHWAKAETPEANTPHVIIAFDLDDENFREMLLPDFGWGASIRWEVMLGEHLSIQCDSSNGGSCEIWLMNEYGNEESWIKKFSQMHHREEVGRSKIFGMGSLETGDIFLKWKNRFALYHPVDGRIRELPICATPDHSDVRNYVNTLIWPVGDV